MEMAQIRYFIAVSDTLNFTRAAERCFISQPALTKGIKKLESSMGGPLLYRTKNSVELSELGRRLLPKFKKIFNDAQAVKEDAQRLIHRSDSLIRVGVQDNIFIGGILPIFEGFRRGHASTEFEFVESDGQQLNEKLSSRELDMAFLSDLSSPPSKDSECAFSSEEFVVVFGERHAFNKKRSVTTEDLHSQHFCYRTHCDSSRYLDLYLRAQGINLNVVYSSSRDDWVSSFVKASFGIAFLPVQQAIADGLHYRQIDGCSVSRSITVKSGDSSMGQNGENSCVQNFIDWINAVNNSHGLAKDRAAAFADTLSLHMPVSNALMSAC